MSSHDPRKDIIKYRLLQCTDFGCNKIALHRKILINIAVSMLFICECLLLFDMVAELGA